MNWVILIFAGFCEVAFTYCLGLFFITTLIASIIGLKAVS